MHELSMCNRFLCLSVLQHLKRTNLSGLILLKKCSCVNNKEALNTGQIKFIWSLLLRSNQSKTQPARTASIDIFYLKLISHVKTIKGACLKDTSAIKMPYWKFTLDQFPVL